MSLTKEQTIDNSQEIDLITLLIDFLRAWRRMWAWVFLLGIIGTALMGFYAELDGENNITLDTEELALAEWFEREDIPVNEAGISLTSEMIVNFKNGGYGK